MDEDLIRESLNNINNLQIIDINSNFDIEDRVDGQIYLFFQNQLNEFVIGNPLPDFHNTDIVLINNENLVTVIFPPRLRDDEIVEQIFILLNDNLESIIPSRVDAVPQTEFFTYLQFARSSNN